MSGPEIAAAEPSDRPVIAALDRAVHETTGHPALGDAVWRDLEHPAPDSVGLLARDGAATVAYLHVARSDTFAPRHWVLGLVRDPATPGTETTRALLAAAERHIANHGGGAARVWIFDPSPADDALLAANRFDRQTDLFQMRVELPLTETATFPDGVEVRAFEPGHDEDAWLDVNNRAFANHPEQGGWIRDTLARRMAEAWFDPSLFLLAFDNAAGEGPALVGSNWLKVHPADGRDPRLGEIFVIGVDPGAQGRGLGRALAVAGLSRLASLDITTGMLYVVAANRGALALYQSLGFTVHRLDRAYEREVPAP